MIGTCKLCDQEKKLCRSHILPKSFTRRMRAGAPQVITVVVEDPPTARKSNGEHIQHMLCEDCEALLKINYEDYGTRIFVNRKNIIENDNHVFILNFDYQKFFLLISSILWRASASSLKIYEIAKNLADLDHLLKPCILKNTLEIPHLRPLRIDDFMRITALKVVDNTNEITQSALDSIILGLNLERGNSIEDGMHYYFMADGFLVIASLFLIDSPNLKLGRTAGRLRDRGFLKIPKVSFHDIKHIREGIEAIASTPDPFK